MHASKVLVFVHFFFVACFGCCPFFTQRVVVFIVLPNYKCTGIIHITRNVTIVAFDETLTVNSPTIEA